LGRCVRKKIRDGLPFVGVCHKVEKGVSNTRATTGKKNQNGTNGDHWGDTSAVWGRQGDVKKELFNFPLRGGKKRRV